MSIILVTHNQFAFTKLCVESIERQTAEPYELIVVDNGSTDGTVEWGKSLGRRAESGEPERGGPERVTVIANVENRGFPAAANQGIRAASGRQILLLNNDTVVTAGWLTRMLRAMESDPAIGMVGPMSNFVSGRQQVRVPYELPWPNEPTVSDRRSGVQEPETAGLKPAVHDAAHPLDTTELDEFARKWGEANEGKFVETDRLVGFCLLKRREMVDRGGIAQFRPTARTI